MGEAFESDDLPGQGRGPAYPYIPLRKAIERIEQIRDNNMARATVSPIAFYKAWGFAGENGNARQTMAALNHFGLVEYIGRGKSRQVKLSSLSQKIVFDRVPDSKERAYSLKDAALSPTSYRKLWEKFGRDLPPDFAFETFLMRDCEFNEIGAKNVISGYRDTFEFAQLDELTTSSLAESASDTEDRTARPVAQVGDLVQVEIDGNLQLPRPTRVRAIREHEGHTWYFVEGSDTGILIDQVVLHTKSTTTLPITPPRLAEEKLDDSSQIGEREWIRGPLSKDTSFRLFVVGGLGSKEIGKLIKILKVQQEISSEEDDDIG